MSKIYQNQNSAVKNRVKHKLGGFTLIELLVVVLIIGILAAIALPQYEKAVARSRLTEMFTISRSLRDAMGLYILENGIPTENAYFVDDGSGTVSSAIEIPCTAQPGVGCFSKYFYWGAFCDSRSCYMSITPIPYNYLLQIYKTHGGEWKYECDANFGNGKVGNSICKYLQNYGFSATFSEG